MELVPETIVTPLSTTEVATALNVKRQTVNRWVREQRLQPMKQLPGVRGTRLFDPAEVARFDAERTT